MALKFPDSAGESACTYNGSTTLTLSGTALTGGRTFANAAADTDIDFDDGDLVAVKAIDADGDFEIWTATWASAGATLTKVSRISIHNTLATTGVTIYAVPSGDWFTLLDAYLGGVREFYVDAAAMVPRDTNGAAVASEEYATNDVMSDHYLFDSITEEGIQFKLAMPDAWDRSTIKVKVFWDAATGASASDGVTWGIAAMAKSNDDAIDAAFPASVDTDDTVIAVGDLHVSPASAAVTVSGTPAIGDLIFFEVTRVVGDANDDMAEDAKLLGIQIQYTESETAPLAW